ncbi:predicted GPI-anchored protein 58 [Humulus lupulus]|uniref:predicted GPI-anchored protein 58 n=1 Tax=Humulus lupulus TaxID=3486 RepID=UPI002B40FAA2|nr:predicted GPI-anchored protein 58 [Humulus lupulus]
MTSANVFDLYSTQEEEEVPLVRKKRLTLKHDGEPSQMPSAKKNRATDPSKDGPSGQTPAQPPAPHEQEIPPPPAPAATTPSPPAPSEPNKLRAMLTMTAARARTSASVEQSRARESKLMEELQAAEARHAGELKVVTQQKDSLAADLVEK